MLVFLACFVLFFGGGFKEEETDLSCVLWTLGVYFADSKLKKKHMLKWVVVSTMRSHSLDTRFGRLWRVQTGGGSSDDGQLRSLQSECEALKDDVTNKAADFHCLRLSAQDSCWPFW